MGQLIQVVWIDAHPLCWDAALVDDILSDRGWPVGYDFDHRIGFKEMDDTGAIVIIPARYHAENVAKINTELARLEWALVLLLSDEERMFPVGQLEHPNMIVWVQTPNDTDETTFLPVGYPPHVPTCLRKAPYPLRQDNWFYSGQVNHQRRKDCMDVLRHMTGGTFTETAGFTRGLAPIDYVQGLTGAKVVPCPSGRHTVDTFRVWEALEAGCIPVVDQATPTQNQWWYWPNVVHDPPFPQVTDWGQFPAIVNELVANWPASANRVTSWWQQYKRSLARRFMHTIRTLSGVNPGVADITVVIPTSPIAAHPDTSLIETTVRSIRHWLPDAEILILCDGVRPEQFHYRQAYERYINRLLWLSGTFWRNVLPIVHDEHLHQTGLLRRNIGLIETPMILFVEHDTPLVTDEHIDWPALVAACRSGEADVIRLHHEAYVLPDHEHLMLDAEPRDIAGAPLLRTVQWSQRPHLALTALYRRLIADYFPEQVGMIEDVMHGVVHNAWREYGIAGWDRFRLWMYAPPGGNVKRSYTLDGRGADQKWVDS